MSIDINRTLDIGFCLSVLSDPVIAEVTREDGLELSDMKIDVLNEYWLRISKSNIALGLAFFKPVYANCYEAHINILPKHRKEHTLEIGRELWQWAESNLKNSLIVTHVPEIYPNVKDFLLFNGFKQSGTLEKAINKSGKKVDLLILTKRTR